MLLKNIFELHNLIRNLRAWLKDLEDTKNIGCNIKIHGLDVTLFNYHNLNYTFENNKSNLSSLDEGVFDNIISAFRESGIVKKAVVERIEFLERELKRKVSELDASDINSFREF